MWKSFLATFLFQSLRCAFSRSRERQPVGTIRNVPAKAGPKAELPIGIDLPAKEGPQVVWLEMPHYLSYEMLDRASCRLGGEDWGQKLLTLQHLVDAEEGDLSLRWAIGIESDRATSLLRNAGILLRPGEGSPSEGSSHPDKLPGDHDAD